MLSANKIEGVVSLLAAPRGKKRNRNRLSKESNSGVRVRLIFSWNIPRIPAKVHATSYIRPWKNKKILLRFNYKLFQFFKNQSI